MADRTRLELTAALRAEIQRSRDLAGAIAYTAGQVADIEDDLAATLEHLAGICPAARVEQLRERARRARSFAEQERREQARWQRVNERADGHTP